MTFLTANWNNLIMVNYTINPEILKPYVPNGTQLDFFNGKCYISLVGFMFEDTKVMGIKFPSHINFEEVNLRFYVKHKEKRGVVFIKEIVPKHLITFIANSIFREHYQTHKMTHVNNKTENLYSYSWKNDGIWNSFKATTKPTPLPLLPNSEAEFIAEHYFGYTKQKDKTYEYEVKHPRWKQLEVINFNIDVQFEKNYGNSFKALDNMSPSSVFLAIGSEISVQKKRLINNSYSI
jgi:uncharacterized protein YqjF (DUF2071 family)